MSGESDPFARITENAADPRPAPAQYTQPDPTGGLAFSHPHGAPTGAAAVFPTTGTPGGAIAPPTANDLNFYNTPATSVGGASPLAWQPPPPSGIAPAYQSPFAPPPLPQPTMMQASPAAPGGTPGAPPPAAGTGTRAFWTIQFWQQFFNVDTNDVKERILCSLLFLKEPPYLSQKKYSYAAFQSGGAVNATGQVSGQDGNVEADLYGPLWICATLWVVMAVVAHTTRNFNCTNDSQLAECTSASWFTPVVAACGVIFGYELFVPFGLWLFMKWKDVPVSLVDTMCLYGYSFFIFIPTSIICAIPFPAVQWTAVGIAWAISTAHIIWNLYGVWKQTLVKKWFTIVVISSVILQLGLCAAFKFEFFASLNK